MSPNEIKELEIQESIIKQVETCRSFRFNAGAGAGKTYALIETLKYVSANKISASQSVQRVACITYTNVAVDEIKSRLGNSDTVQVSTIHERLWELIKRAQPELLVCHREKIAETIEQYNKKLNDKENKQTRFFARLDRGEKQCFLDFVLENKELFYKTKKLKARLFQNAYEEVSDSSLISKCLDRNVVNFKKTVSLIYKNQMLKDCLKRIEAGEEKKVVYDSKVNIDRLHYMKFSHDTLLEYGLKLVERYPTLIRIIIDTYPYFFIDEYQDTHSNVVKLVKLIHDYSIENNKCWLVGYFGDTAQNIYDDGVGQDITSLHSTLVNIDKVFNRRSHQQIIDVANNIRSDEITQKPIFDERNTGSVQFFYSTSGEKVDTSRLFLEKYKSDLIPTNDVEKRVSDTEKTKIHCLVLTNKLMAKFNGFGDVYDVYSKSKIYYDNLNTQVLSQQVEKLNPTILTIYYITKFYNDIKQGHVSYEDIFGPTSKELAFSKASLIISELKNKQVISLNDWIILITDRLENSGAKYALRKALMNCVHYNSDKLVTAEVFHSTFLESISVLMVDSSEEEDGAREKIDSILTLPITSLIRWVNFIDGKENVDISYHTYHGTKGEEYENVAIILEHSFGARNKDKFKKYFQRVRQEAEGIKPVFTNIEDEKNHINTRNLLYVACSRAVKNLRVLYLDDISEISIGINAIFGESNAWSMPA